VKKKPTPISDPRFPTPGSGFGGEAENPHERQNLLESLQDSGFTGEQENTADRLNTSESLSVSSEEEADAKDEEEVTGLGKYRLTDGRLASARYAAGDLATVHPLLGPCVVMMTMQVPGDGCADGTISSPPNHDEHD
jgi:hypothetical protein